MAKPTRTHRTPVWALVAALPITSLATAATATPTAPAAPAAPPAVIENYPAFTGDDPAAALAAKTTPNSAAITGATPATAGQYPWMVKLTIGKGTTTTTCAGTAISTDTILTAAHCVQPTAVDWINAYVGNVVWHHGTKVAVTNVIRGSGPGNGDWAVLKTQRAMPITAVAILPNTATMNTGPTFTTLGWGTTNTPTGPVLRAATVKAVTDAACGAGANELCADGWAKGGIDSCRGDSGGPLMNFVDGNPIQVGVTSRGDDCTSPKNPGKYTEVSTYADAISRAVSQLGGGAPTFFARSPAQQPQPGTTTPRPVTTPQPEPTKIVPDPDGTMVATFNRPFWVPNYRRSTSGVTVTDTSASKITLTINANHKCSNHLKIELLTPDGNVHVLKDPAYATGAGCNVWLGPRSETYSLKGDPSGSWQLRISDFFGGESGSVQSWSIATI